MILPVDITSAQSTALVDAPGSAATSANPLASLTGTAGAVSVTQGALQNLTQNAVGQLFQTQVLMQLTDGTFVVNVAGNALRMALPTGTTVGSNVPMTLISTDPRPAFLVGQQNDGSSAQLSDAAKVINTALQTAQEAGVPTTLVGKTPLLPTPTANAPQIAVALQDSVEFSGLFYESHVNQWVSGERPLSDLLLEPQAQSNQGQAAAATNKSGATTTNATVLQRPTVNTTELTKLIDTARNVTAESKPTLSQTLTSLLNNNRGLPQEADTMVSNTTMSKETAQTINLQLNTLEQHRIAWQGELWPGQKMEWEITDESPQGSRGGQEEGTESWQSVVRFELPSLGKITATIHLSGGHVRMQVNTTSPDATATLKAHGDELATALDTAGSPLDSLIVKNDQT